MAIQYNVDHGYLVQPQNTKSVTVDVSTLFMVKTRCSQQKMSKVLQVLEILKSSFCGFSIFWPPKDNSTYNKKPTERDDDDEKNKFYIKINDSLYYLVNFMLI